MSSTPSKTSLRKLEALNILCGTHGPEDIMSQLIADGSLDKAYALSEIRGKRQSEKVEALLVMLDSLNKSGKLMLVDFEWQMLPQHKVKLTLVTPAGVREYEAT